MGLHDWFAALIVLVWAATVAVIVTDLTRRRNAKARHVSTGNLETHRYGL